MEQMKLTGELMERMQGMLIENDPQARDPGIAAQYLAAIIGVMLGNTQLQAPQREQILRQLFEFTGQVCNDVAGEQQPPQQEAFGIWKPGQ